MIGGSLLSRRARLRQIAGARVDVVAREVDRPRRALGRGLLAGGIALALAAAFADGLARAPVDAAPGHDLVVCLDVSRSMLAADVAPSRLERAKQAIAELAARVRGDRLALVLHAGEARLQVPLTEDAASFAELAAMSAPESVRRGGSDLGAALTTALAALPPPGEPDRAAPAAILLLSDGEDFAGHALEAARRCRERGVPIHAIGFGSERGAKIAVDEPEGSGGAAFLRDRAGVEVVSALESAALRRLAEKSGGDYVDASASPQPLVALYEQTIAPHERASGDADPRVKWPLLAALLLWIVELAWGDRSGERGRA